MTESLSMDGMIAIARRVLLRPREVEFLRRRRMFRTLLADCSHLTVTPTNFLEVYDRVVKPIILAATHCRVSLSAEQYPELERAATSDADTYRSRIARYRLKQWDEAGVSPGPWLQAFTNRLKPPLKEHLTSELICKSPEELTDAFTFSVPAGDVEVNLASEAVNTPLFWWWLLCGDLGVVTVFIVDSVTVDSPTFWQRAKDPHTFGGHRFWWDQFAWRATARSTRVAMIINRELRLSTYAATGTIERLYRTAAESALISEEKAREVADRAKFMYRDVE